MQKMIRFSNLLLMINIYHALSSSSIVVHIIHTLTNKNHLDTYFDSISNTYLSGKICTLCDAKGRTKKKNLANILTVILTKSTTTMMMTNNILTSFHFVPTINLIVCVFQIYKPLFD